MQNKTILISSVILSIALLVVAGAYFFQGSQSALGSVPLANEYHATTTGFYSTQNVGLINTGTGSLGSIIVTTAGSAGGNLEFYDATTTNINNRTGKTATSSILITSVPNNLAAGTYTFDVYYKTGLIYACQNCASRATTTITWR